MGGTFKFLSLAFLLLFSHMVIAITATSSSSSNKNANFIKTSCRTTTYPSLCNQYLSSYASAVRSNPWKLCNSALAVSLQAAHNTSSLVTKLSRRKGLTNAEASAIKDCVENVGDGIDELKQSLKTMGQIERGSSAVGTTGVEFQMANVKTWVSAAITDEATCTDGLDERKEKKTVSADVKNQIRSSIVTLASLTSNALSLINSLRY